MKSVVIIAIVAVAMIGVMVPSAFAETYVFENLENVSIDVPSSWFASSGDKIVEYGLIQHAVDKSGLSGISVQYLASAPSEGAEQGKTNVDISGDTSEEAFEYIKSESRSYCERYSGDATCSQHEIIDTIRHTVDGYRAFSVIEKFVLKTTHGGYYGKAGNYDLMGLRTVIDVDKTMWHIILFTPEEKFEKYEALKIAESLNLKNTDKKDSASPENSISSSNDSYDFYQDDFGIFSMNYPEDWYVLNEGEGSALFLDSKNNWKNSMQVFYYEDTFYDQLTTNEIKNELKIFEEDRCYDSTFEIDGYICYDFTYFDSKKIKSNPPTFKTSVSYVKEYDGISKSFYINAMSIDIIDKENLWTVFSESQVNGLSSSKIQQNSNMISKAMESFSLKEPTSKYSSLSNLPTLEYYYYVDDLPDWADSNFYKSAVKKAIQKISQENPWLTFREVAYEDSEIDISWIKEYGTGTLGEAHSTLGLVHIQMGDSECGMWLPHSEEMLADTIAHELLHGVGFEHVNNPKSIMYYQASDSVYAYEEYSTYQFEEYVYQFIPLCTIKNTTDYFVEVSSDEYDEKFDVFFVKSASDAEKYGNGDYFNKYSSCYEEDTSHFSKTCSYVSSSGGIVIGTDYISDGIADIDVFISETRYDPPTDYSLEQVDGLEYVLGVNANFESDRQNYSKAISIYKKILESNPNDTFALNNLGTVYDELGDSVKAMQYYEKTLRLNPLDEFALSNIGTVLQEQGKYKEAIEYYEKALDVNPQSVFALQMEREAKILLEESNQGGGCLIATATYGSEMALEVQQLRELRDNTLLNTESGTSFMKSFNDVYYSFSPYIADMERENPVFKEMVKLAITPMISSLSILNYVDMNSESEVLGYGISLILLNLGMYLGVPAVVIIGIKKRF